MLYYNYQKRVEWSTALEIEENTVMKWYVMNLRDKIGIQVRSLQPTTFAKAQPDVPEAEAWHREKLRIRPSTLSNGLSPITITRKALQQTHRNIIPSIQVHNRPNDANAPNHSMVCLCNKGYKSFAIFVKKLGTTSPNFLIKVMIRVSGIHSIKRDHHNDWIRQHIKYAYLILTRITPFLHAYKYSLTNDALFLNRQ